MTGAPESCFYPFGISADGFIRQGDAVAAKVQFDRLSLQCNGGGMDGLGGDQQ